MEKVTIDIKILRLCFSLQEKTSFFMPSLLIHVTATPFFNSNVSTSAIPYKGASVPHCLIVQNDHMRAAVSNFFLDAGPHSRSYQCLLAGLVPVTFNGKSSYDVTLVCVYVYLSVLFPKYNIANEWSRS